MKKTYLLFIPLLACLILGCSNEQLSQDFALKNQKAASNVAIEPIDPADAEGHCVYTHLIAGQHHVAGSITVDNDGENLIITFSTDDDWTLGTTHLSIGNCDEDWAPLNGGGNPQVGQFEYTEPYSAGPHEVVYIVSLEGLDDHYCFATHAEVEGPAGGETAWGQGTQFNGNGWAMFVESFLSNCPPDEDDGGGDQLPT
jgi:hypothetical protein